MSTSVDCIVVSHSHGGWEVRTAGSTRPGIHASSRSEALQWAWNIIRTTGGKVVLRRSDGSET